MAARSPDDFPGTFVSPKKEEDDRDRLKNRHHPHAIKKSECIHATASQKPNEIPPSTPLLRMGEFGIEANLDHPHHRQQFEELFGLPTTHLDVLTDTDLANAFVNSPSNSTQATSTDTDTWNVNPSLVPECMKTASSSASIAIPPANTPYLGMGEFGIEANLDHPHDGQQFEELFGLPTTDMDVLTDTDIANAFVNSPSHSTQATGTDTDSWLLNPSIVPEFMNTACSSASIEIPPANVVIESPMHVGESSTFIEIPPTLDIDIDSWLTSGRTPSSVPRSKSTFVPFDTNNDEPPSNSDIDSHPTSARAPSAGPKFKYTFVPVETHIDKPPANADIDSLPTRARTPSAVPQYRNTYATISHINKPPANTGIDSLPPRARTPSSVAQYMNTYATISHIYKPPANADIDPLPTRARTPSAVPQYRNTYATISHINKPPANTGIDSRPTRARTPSAVPQHRNTLSAISHIDLPPANAGINSLPTRARTPSAVAQYMNTLTAIAHINQQPINAVIESRLTNVRTSSTVTQYINTFALIGHIDKPAAIANINARPSSGNAPGAVSQYMNMLGCSVLDERPPDNVVVAYRLKKALAASALTDIKHANASRPATALTDAISISRPTVTQHTSAAIASFTDTHATSVKTQLKHALLLPASATNSDANKCDAKRPRHEPKTLAGARFAAALAERQCDCHADSLQHQPDHADKFYDDGSKKY